MEEWGIWSESQRGDGTIVRGEWWTDKSNLVFHSTTKVVALVQLEHICEHWLARDGVGHFSVRSFQTGEVIRTVHPGQAHAEWKRRVEQLIRRR